MKFRQYFWGLLSIAYSVILLLLSVVPYWPKEWWWLANAIEIMPLWVLVIPLIVFINIVIASKNIQLIAVQFIGIIFLIFFIMGWQFHPMPKHQDVSGFQKIRIMSINIDSSSTRFPDLQKLIQSQKPDIVIFQEFNSSQIDVMKKILPQDWALNMEGSGLGFASRFPIAATEAKNREPFGGWGSFVRHYALTTPSGVINFFNVHLATPRPGIEALMEKKFGGIEEMKDATEQQNMESLLASRWAKEFSNVIVAGDFNMQTKNPVFHQYWSYLMDAFSEVGNGFGYTKHTRWHGVRIDHVLADKNWRAVNFNIGPDVGSDHHPIVVDLISTFSGDFKTSQPNVVPNIFSVQNYQSSFSPELIGEYLNLDDSQFIRFKYRIQAGDTLGLKAQTQFGDWMCLGGTKDFVCDAASVFMPVVLINDGNWHEASFNVRESVNQLLPSLKVLQALEFKFDNVSKQGFDIDQWRLD